MLGVLIVSVLLGVSSADVNLDQTIKRSIREVEYKYNMVDPGKGSFTNCGVAKNFSMTWMPKQPSPRGSLTAELNFIAPYDFAEGKGKVDVYLKEMPQPIVELDQSVSCEEARVAVPALKCPVKAGSLVHLTYTAEKLPALPAGDYDLKVELLNAKGQQVLCGKAEITIQL